MDFKSVRIFRDFLNLLICLYWAISLTIASLPISSFGRAHFPILLTFGGAFLIDALEMLIVYDTSVFESRILLFAINIAPLVGKNLLLIPIELLNRYFNDKGATISRRPWTILELHLALTVVELASFLLAYLINLTKWINRRHRASIWWHLRIDFGPNVWYDHDELIAFLKGDDELKRYLKRYDESESESDVDGKDDDEVEEVVAEADQADEDSDNQEENNDWDDDNEEADDSSRPYHIATRPIIDLNTTSNPNNIDRLIYSIIIFNCKECKSDNGIYLMTTSLLLRMSRFVKISTRLPIREHAGTDHLYAYIQNGLVMCVFESDEGEDVRTKFLLYDINDDSKREFDVHDMMEFDSDNFWCLKDDGREFGRAIKTDATYVRIIYGCKPNDNVGYVFRQSLLEIPSGVDGEIKVKQLQEIVYRWNWEFTDHGFRWIRTSQGHVGIIGELVDPTLTTGEDDEDGTRWTTCVVYSPETRRLSATGDYERYLEIDPVLRRCFDRNMNSRESMRSLNFTSMRRIKGMFLCPNVLTDARAIDVMDDGSIRSIDFEPRSLKWLCLRKVLDAYGENLGTYWESGWFRLTGVKLDTHIWD